MMINLECVDAGETKEDCSNVVEEMDRERKNGDADARASHPINDRQRKKIEYQLFTKR